MVQTKLSCPSPQEVRGLLHRGYFTGPLKELTLGPITVKWVSHTRLIGVTVDNKLTWARHTSEVKKSYTNKLNLVKRCRFLPRCMLLDLYFKIILPSITYAMSIWGGCTNRDSFNCLEAIHRRAAKFIFNLPRDTPSTQVLEMAKWDSLYQRYKVGLATLVYNVYNENTPCSMRHIVARNTTRYRLRNNNKVSVPSFNTRYMKYSITHRGAIVWNSITTSIDNIKTTEAFRKIARSSVKLRNLDFGMVSAQTTPHDPDFIYY